MQKLSDVKYDIYEKGEYKIYVTISNAIKSVICDHPKCHSVYTYHFIYGIGLTLQSYSKYEFENNLCGGSGNYDKLKRELLSYILRHRDIHNCPDTDPIRKATDVKIYKYNVKYDHLMKGKYPDIYQSYIPPMCVYNDNPIKSVSEINQNEIYFVYCIGVWNKASIDHAKKQWKSAIF